MATQRICDNCGVVMEGGPKYEVHTMIPITNTHAQPFKAADLCSVRCLLEVVESMYAEERAG